MIISSPECGSLCSPQLAHESELGGEASSTVSLLVRCEDTGQYLRLALWLPNYKYISLITGKVTSCSKLALLAFSFPQHSKHLQHEVFKFQNPAALGFLNPKYPNLGHILFKGARRYCLYTKSPIWRPSILLGTLTR